MTSDDYERVGRAVVGMLDAMATARNFGEVMDAMEDHLPRLKDSIPPDRRHALGHLMDEIAASLPPHARAAMAAHGAGLDATMDEIRRKPGEPEA